MKIEKITISNIYRLVSKNIITIEEARQILKDAGVLKGE